MSKAFKSFLQRWIVTTLAVLVATHVIPGIYYDDVVGLVVATLVLGILNAIVRPIIVVLSLPLLIFTLGLFMLVINALFLYWVGHVVRGFHVEDFWSAFWAGMVISIVSLLINSLTRTGDSRVEFRRKKDPPKGDGQGPVIDV